MDLNDLENYLNGNRIDLRKLHPQQKIFLKGLIEQGYIESEDLATLEKKQHEAAKKVSERMTLESDPIAVTTSDWLNREKVAAYFDIGLLSAQLLLDRKKMAQILINPGKYIAQLSKITSNFKNPALNKLVVGLKQIQKMVGGEGPIAGQMILRSTLAGATGYATGGYAYDMADEITRDLMDIKKSKGVKTFKDMGVQNPLLRTLDDYRVGLIYAGGAELLGPVMAAGMYKLRKMFALESAYSRELATIAKNKNLPANYIMLADPNQVGGQIVKTVNKVVGQLPFVGGPAKRAQKEAAQLFNDMSAKAFEIEPGMHLATIAAASEETANAILKNYERFQWLNNINYNRVFDMAKAYGDPRVIELAGVKKVMKYLEDSAFAPPEIKQGFLEPERLKTGFGQFYDAYAKLVAANRKISISNYVDLRKLLNRTVANLGPNDPGVPYYTLLREALEKDFARMDLSPQTVVGLNFPVMNKALLEASGTGSLVGEVTDSIGKLGLTQEGKANIKVAVEDAFSFYANNIKTFESRAARVASAFDENALTLKQLQGFEKAGSINKDQVLRTLSRNIFQLKDAFSFKAITDLQKLVDADVYKLIPERTATGTTYKVMLEKAGGKPGNKTLERLFTAHIGDAYQKSFEFVEKRSFGDWIGTLLGKESQRAQTTGMSKTLQEMKQANGLPLTHMQNGNYHFNPNIFRKLILPNEAAAKQFEVIFGKEKAWRIMDEYDQLLKYMDAVRSYAVPSASVFMGRRLVLGGMGAGAVAGGMYGLGPVTTLITLFLANRGNRILSNPEALHTINTAFKHFLENPGPLMKAGQPIRNEFRKVISGVPTASRIALSRLANMIITEETGKKYGTSDVDFMEILDYLQNSPVEIDQLTDLHMNKEIQDNWWPPMTKEQYLASLNTLPDLDVLADKMGGLPVNVEEEAMMRTAVNQLPPKQPVTANTLPRQAGLRMPGAGVKPIDYQSLFPFDPIGNLISERKQETTPQPVNPNAQRQS